MTSTTQPMQPLFKREHTVAYGGLITPNESMSTAGLSTLHKSHHGLMISQELDEGYQTQVPDRRLRSNSPSLLSTQINSRTPHLPGVNMASQVPGASLQIVGEQVNLLVDAIEQLRKLGIREIDTELPELVLIGDQSAGKSSLMSAIAEINLPKNMGMCTRCPANIKTSPADTWSCTVSLQEYYHFSNDARRVPTKANLFPPWKENEEQGLVITHFKTVSDKTELEEVLRWAQIALLNPSQDYHAFIPGSGTIAQNGLKMGHKHEADFSPNIVAIEIAGPRLPALSFYDLPGIFLSAATVEEQYLVKVFENLAEKYIKRENALIILAITMASDPGLSRTKAIIDHHRAGKRTIGVLTKPDRLQKGQMHQDFDAILKGTERPLARGYFVTKQPGPDFVPRGDYHAQAREEETAFFDSDPLWCGEWHAYRDRCGTAAIQTYLSQEFARLIAQSMPSIDGKIQAETQLVDAKLAKLPELPNDNVQHVVRQCLQGFSDGVRRILEGGPASNEFLSDWTQLSLDFAEAIQLMKPMFTVTDSSDSILPDVISIDDESDGSSSRNLSSPRSQFAKRPIENPFTPQAKRQSLDPHSRGYANPNYSRPKNEDESPTQLHRRSNGKRITLFHQYHNAGKRFMTIAEVKSVISKHRRPGHPGIVTDAAREEICLTSLWPWNGPLKTLSDATFQMLRSAVLRVMDRTIGHYKQTDMFQLSKRKILEFLAQHQADQRRALDAIYELETYKLFTLNEPAFLKYQEEELKLLQAKRRENRVRCYIQRQAFLSKKTLTDASKLQLEKTTTDDELGLDPFRLEIETAAYVRGYYKTAGYRFADNLCQSILGNLLKTIQKEIPFLLENYFQLNNGDSESKCRNLMVEDHGEAEQRTALQEQKNKLNRAADRLAKLVQELRVSSRDMDIDPLYVDEEDAMHSDGSQTGDFPTPSITVRS